MFGILLTILKIIGIILLVLLGLILTIVAVILLVPIRYRGQGAYEEKVLSGNAKITWLLHMLSIDISFSSKGTVLTVRLFGKTIYPKTEKTPKKRKEKKAKSQSQPKKKEALKKEPPKPQPKKDESVVSEPKRFEELPKKTQEVETVYEPQTSLPALQEPQTSQSEKESNATKQAKAKESKEFQQTKELKESSKNEQTKESEESQKEKTRKDPLTFVQSKFEAIKKKLLAIKDKFLATKAKLQKTKDKLAYWKNLLTSEPMKDAIATLWKHTKGLLRHILPRKLTGRVRFGFEDPSMTGKVLAYLSMLYPFTKDNLVIEPEFETEELVLEGNLAFRGKIRLGYLVYVALCVVLNKNIRRQYKRLRQGGKEDGEGRN